MGTVKKQEKNEAIQFAPLFSDISDRLRLNRLGLVSVAQTGPVATDGYFVLMGNDARHLQNDRMNRIPK